MNILFLSRWFPFPPDNGSKIRIFNLLKGLAAHHRVHLISFAEAPVSVDQVEALREWCAEVDVVMYRPFQPTRLRALAGFFSSRPRSVEDTFSSEMRALVERTAQAQSFEAVIASQIDMAPYVETLPVARKIFEELELTTLYEQFMHASGALRKTRAGLMWWKQAHYAANLLRGFNVCTVVSEAERARLRAIAPDYASAYVIPNGVDVTGYTGDFGPVEPDTLVYAGALTYHANFDAVDYFLREIFPRIQSKRPQVQLRITGRLEGVPVERLPQRPGVIFTGYLADVRPTVARSAVSIAPLRVGGGTRLKILEAMALGTPVVATSKGAEGLEAEPERHLLLADTPAEFADAVLRLLSDETLRQTLCHHARCFVEARYDWVAIGQHFSALVAQSGLAPEMNS